MRDIVYNHHRAAPSILLLQGRQTQSQDTVSVSDCDRVCDSVSAATPCHADAMF